MLFGNPSLSATSSESGAARSLALNSSAVRGWREAQRIVSLALLGAIAFSTSAAFAQRDKEEEEIPAPETVNLQTKDRVQLTCTYYQGLAEKKSVPVLLVHDWDGSRADFEHLATKLQALGHSVLVPDLRGHGESLSVLGASDQIDREKMRRQQIASTSLDLEACKKFLMEKNDEGKLNIDMLTVVAAGKMSIIAANWTITDWSYPVLGGKRQGQDVKALVFLSPERKFRGLSMIEALRNPLFTGRGATPLSVVVAAGTEDRTAKREAETVHTGLDRYRPDLDLEDKTEEERSKIIADKQDLFLWEFDVDYQGTNLVHQQASLPLTDNIGKFIYYRLLQKESQYPWQVREKE